MAGRPATLADVARAVGLSTPTVSRALRDHPDVSDSTRSRVKSVAAELGYTGSPTARALRTGRYNAVSFVVPLGLIGWWDPLLKGASREAARLGYQLVLNPVSSHVSGIEVQEPHGDDIASFFRRSATQPVDGFVVVTPDNDDWKQLPEARRVPSVIIDDLREHPGWHTWSSDNRAGARAAVQHLIDRGRRRIVAVAPRAVLDGMVVDERLAGYREALDAAGLPEFVVETAETYPPTLVTSDAVDGLLADGDDFDAVFVLADFAAYSIMRSLRRAGRAVPEEIAVIGFDDDPAAAAIDPPLTTMAQPLDAIGAGAVRTLIELVEGADIPAVSHRLDTALIERSST